MDGSSSPIIPDPPRRRLCAVNGGMYPDAVTSAITRSAVCFPMRYFRACPLITRDTVVIEHPHLAAISCNLISFMPTNIIKLAQSLCKQWLSGPEV